MCTTHYIKPLLMPLTTINCYQLAAILLTKIIARKYSPRTL